MAKKIQPTLAIFDDHSFLSSTIISENVLNNLETIVSRSSELDLDVVKHEYLLGAGYLKGLMGNKQKQETFNAYRRDLEKYFQWSWLIAKKSILELKPSDLQDFLKFVTSPPLHWQHTQIENRFDTIAGDIRTQNKSWKPFVHKMPKASIKDSVDQASKMALDVRDSYLDQMQEEWLKENPYRASDSQVSVVFTVMNKFYTYVAAEGASERNPWIAIDKKKYTASAKNKQLGPLKLILKQESIMMIIDELKGRFEEAREYAEQVDKERAGNPSLKRSKSPARLEAEKYGRMYFAFSVIFLLYVRVSELCDNPRCKPMMRDFSETESEGRQIWKLKIIGKGDKMRERTVNPSVMAVLRDYREFLGLPPYPLPNEEHPIIPSVRGSKGISRRSLTNIIQECFDIGYELAVAKGDEREASQLKIATTHWLRHTGISIEVNSNKRAMGHTRLEAGHESLDTTSRYHDAQLSELAESNTILDLGNMS